MATVVQNFRAYDPRLVGGGGDLTWDAVESGTLQTETANEIERPWSLTLPVDSQIQISGRINANQQGTALRNVTFFTAHFQRDGSGAATQMGQVGHAQSVSSGMTQSEIEGNGNDVRLKLVHPNNTIKLHWNWVIAYILVTPIYV